MAGLNIKAAIGIVGLSLAALSAFAVVRIYRLCRDRPACALIALAAIVPAIPLRKFMGFGLSEYVGGHFPDGWNYVLYAQFLLDGEHGRFPLYAQWIASGMSGTRFASAAWIAFFAYAGPDAFSGQGPYLAFLVFVFASSCVALGLSLWVKIDWRAWMLAGLSAVSPAVLGAIQLSNFDTLLATALAPALVALTLHATKHDWKLAVLAGAVAGALLLAQIEIFPFVLIAPALIIGAMVRRDVVGWPRWAAVGFAAFVLSSAAWIPQGTKFVIRQIRHIATDPIRAGDGYYLTMLDLRCAIPTAWALDDPWNSCVGIAWPALLVSMLLTGLVIIGCASLFKRLPALPIALALIVIITMLVLVTTAYPYPAFKIIAAFAGVIVVFLVQGIYSLGKTRAVTGALCIGCAVVLAVNSRDRTRQLDSLLPYKTIRDYRAIASMVEEKESIGLDIQKTPPFIWALYFLRDRTFDPSIYKLDLFYQAARMPDRPQSRSADVIVSDHGCPEATTIRSGMIYSVCLAKASGPFRRPHQTGTLDQD
jgi:hypothetical protein